MKIYKQIDEGNSRLLLFFAGWSVSPLLFEGMEAEEATDVWIVYDYRTTTFDADLAAYTEIHLVAWSMGVWAADRLMQCGSIRPTTATALNGTPCPISDTYGIPTAIFRGTLEGLTAEGLGRFNRRMCGNRELLAAYEQTAPARPLAEVREELQAIYDAISAEAAPPSCPGWTRAIVATADRIFPPANQQAYWQGRCPVVEIAAPHYPFYLWTKWNELWTR